MKNEFNFLEITERVKNALNIKADYELAERLGMKATSFNSRKKAKSWPYEELLLLANTEKLNMDWLLTGEGTMLKGSGGSDELNEETRWLVSMYSKLTPEDRADAAKEIKKIAEITEWEFQRQRRVNEGDK